MFRSASVNLLLKDSGVDNVAHADLLNKPDELIADLFDKYTVGPLARHEIKVIAIVEQISKYLNIDYEPIRQRLISAWLLDESDDGSGAKSVDAQSIQISLKSALDDSVDEPKPASSAGSRFVSLLPVSQSDMRLAKAVFLLRIGDQSQSVSYLLNVAFSERSQQIHTATRLRALRALFSVANPDFIVKSSGKTIQEFRSLIASVSYVCRLSELRVNQTVKEFTATNKEGLVRLAYYYHLEFYCSLLSYQVRSLWRSLSDGK